MDGVVFGVDIDGTIAGRNLYLFKQMCSERFELNIEPDLLATMGYQRFMQCAQMKAYHERAGDERFEAAVEAIEQDPAMLAALPVMDGAVEALKQLAEGADITYYTVRKSSDPVRAAICPALSDRCRKMI